MLQGWRPDASPVTGNNNVQAFRIHHTQLQHCNTERAGSILQYYGRVRFETRSGHRLLHTRSTSPLGHRSQLEHYIHVLQLSAATLSVLLIIKYTTRTNANCSIHKLHRIAAMLVHHYSIGGKNLWLVAWAGTQGSGIANTSDVTSRYPEKQALPRWAEFLHLRYVATSNNTTTTTTTLH
jgi:hypothetical protein